VLAYGLVEGEHAFAGQDVARNQLAVDEIGPVHGVHAKGAAHDGPVEREQIVQQVFQRRVCLGARKPQRRTRRHTFVISRYTAKARSGNIYRKLGIHTREELLDLVERKKQPKSA